MKFLKKLAFRLVRDDIEAVLKAHDKTIMDHYYKIIDDVEDIMELRNEQIDEILNEILRKKLSSLDKQFEELKTGLHREVEVDTAPDKEDNCGCFYCDCETIGETDA
jgi:hypothetical protein